MIIKARLLQAEGKQPVRLPVCVRAWIGDAIPADPRVRAALEVAQPMVEVNWPALSQAEQDWFLGKRPAIPG